MGYWPDRPSAGREASRGLGVLPRSEGSTQGNWPHKAAYAQTVPSFERAD